MQRATRDRSKLTTGDVEYIPHEPNLAESGDRRSDVAVNAIEERSQRGSQLTMSPNVGDSGRKNNG